MGTLVKQTGSVDSMCGYCHKMYVACSPNIVTSLILLRYVLQSSIHGQGCIKLQQQIDALCISLPLTEDIECSDASKIMQQCGMMFVFYTGLPHMTLYKLTLASFPGRQFLQCMLYLGFPQLFFCTGFTPQQNTGEWNLGIIC